MTEEIPSWGDPEKQKQKERKEQKPTPTSVDNVSTPFFKKLDKIADSIDKLTGALNALLTTLVGQVRDRPSSTPLPPPEQESTESDINRLKAIFPSDLKGLIAFSDEGAEIKIKPRQFLGSENFAKIASIVREVGGTYVSAGKESHFKVPKPPEE